MTQDETLLDQFLGETFSKLSHENLSLFAFIWTMYIARLGTGGGKGNFYKFDIGNGFYNAEIKVTIKRKMTAKEREDFKNVWGFDIDKAIKEFQDAGLIEKEEIK